MRDAGTDLRKALGLSEPDWSKHRPLRDFGGFKNAEDARDFGPMEDAMQAREEAEARAASLSQQPADAVRAA